MHLSYTQKQYDSQTGFSIIELLITISIVVLITGLVLARYSSFDGTVLLKNQAYDIALDIRLAQSYGFGSSAAGSDFRDAYGVYFSTAASQNQQYIIFQDMDEDGSYDVGEEVVIQKLQDSFSITALSGGSTPNELAITFKRPNFDAIFSGGGTAQITITSDDSSGFSRDVIVGAGGYVAVQ